jgi:hypothetical protein
VKRWSKVERKDDAVVKTGHEHKKMLSGDVLWCSRCGVYADKKAKGLLDSCSGKPPKGGGGRMEGQLRKLRNNIHPKTGEAIPWPMEVDKDTAPIVATNVDVDHVPPDGFYQYVPTVFPVATASNSIDADDRKRRLRERIKAKEQMRENEAGDALRDCGGGVWDFLFPDEPRTTVQEASTNLHGLGCKGKYRLRTKGPACRGIGCC